MAHFDCATWRPVNAHGGTLSDNLGLVLHHAVMDGSCWDVFQDGDTSAHFWVSKSGEIEQYVDSDVVAWHGVSLNAKYVSVETEGCATPPHAEPMTEAMVDALARLYAEGMRRHGWPAKLAEVNGQAGFGYHRMQGSGVSTACPCDVRLNMREEILRRATGAPEMGDDEMVVLVQAPNGGWTVLDLASGTYRGLSTPGLLDFYRDSGVKDRPRPKDWDRFEQVGTI